MVKKNLKRWLAALPPWSLTVAGLAVILWLTLAPHPLGEEELPMFPGADKLGHCVMFGGFTLLLLLDCSRRRGWVRLPALRVWSFGLISALLGVVVEIAQWKMELGRSFEWWDILADSVGAFLCSLLWILFADRLLRD